MTDERLTLALRAAVDTLVSDIDDEGYWEGELSSSALSTATALSALSVAGVDGDAQAIRRGVSWLKLTQNTDGGWGDTTDSPSNLATTLLVSAALRLAGTRVFHGQEEGDRVAPADSYIHDHAGESPEDILNAVQTAYGADRTFAVPILMNCALAGMTPWERIPALPFELAAFPQSWYKALRLHVVSYALPALIAIGLSIDHHTTSGNVFQRVTRKAVTGLVLAKLARIQPEHGGFLDATPLTSFVAMSLAPVYGPKQPVVAKCIAFIRDSQREDGSWPIDSNLSVWMTTNAVSALARASRLEMIDTRPTLDWILARQHRTVHEYTGALPGGWGWTHLPGGVPDADDTSGAILACLALGERRAARIGAQWLLRLQNADGGWPTFCRGWGHLPFDKSCPDVTAHALRALAAFDEPGCQRAARRGFAYLARVQRKDGAWVPLWFGNQGTADKSNPVMGTALVLRAYARHLRVSPSDSQQGSRPCTPSEQEDQKDTCFLVNSTSEAFADGLEEKTSTAHAKEAANGVEYLLGTQNPDGGWGGGPGVASSVEETALALTALLGLEHLLDSDSAARAGLAYLVRRIEHGSWTASAPVGLYFSSLWYSEKLYPIIWTVEALGLSKIHDRH